MTQVFLRSLRTLLCTESIFLKCLSTPTLFCPFLYFKALQYLTFKSRYLNVKSVKSPHYKLKPLHLCFVLLYLEARIILQVQFFDAMHERLVTLKNSYFYVIISHLVKSFDSFLQNRFLMMIMRARGERLPLSFMHA